ncbi:GNAT family N-acetyltransferase [Pseudosporangium ferrugineum]|uniref:Putative acetyltransferase n=1 Tax=Pseudosporangium ferrugineum TaxID=439699 RepID=A0A2T0RFS9_9ACTN|nr:GNAT family N-acetyltransferase [Pseudosporangium ferrugineum]PRY19999.1 putative acetyltransferase [Pseudosporangium ferrugineum]
MDRSEIPIRAGTADDWASVSGLLSHVFHHTMSAEERDVEGSVFEPERALVADDAGTVVGHAAAYTRELTVPGAVLPAAHVTQVGVLPTHRRRGLLTRMMHRQLREIAAAGREPIAVLWASETKIYPRFGYGPAAQRLRMSVMTREVRLPGGPAPAPGSRLRMVDPLEAIPELSKVYEQLRATRTGWSSRDERWWRFVLSDLESLREGATAQYAVVHETADGPTGYAVWRVKGEWNEHGPDAEVRVREVVAADPEAYRALWHFVLSIDLARKADVSFATLDEPLQYLVDEPRRLGTTLADGLWIRIVDLPRALAAREYAAPVDVVFDVADPLLDRNTGRWRLTADASGKATCTRTEDPADLACTVLELGTVYLGAVPFAALGAAGTVRELTPGALRAATTAFGWHRMPNPTEVF